MAKHASDVAKASNGERMPAYPFANLRDEMNTVFEKFFGNEPFSLMTDMPLRSYLRPDASSIVPNTDISETDEALILTAELPGIDEKDINLTVKDGLLILSGEKRWEKDEKVKTRHTTERRYGSFERRLSLPKSVNPEEISAEFNKGILTVTLPKHAELTEPEKQIRIKFHD